MDRGAGQTPSCCVMLHQRESSTYLLISNFNLPRIIHSMVNVLVISLCSFFDELKITAVCVSICIVCLICCCS